MADTVITDAARVPQDEGFPNISDGNEAWNSAGLMALLGQAAQSGSYVRSNSELDFSSHDGTNDTVDVNAGVAYISLAGETVNVQSGLGGSSQAYDTTITTNTMPAVCVVLPSATTVNLQDSTLSSIWLAYDTDGTGPGSAGSVYLRSDDTGSVTAPSHPNVKLGESNPDNSSADTLENRFASPTYNSVSADQADINQLFEPSTSLSLSLDTWASISNTTDALLVVRLSASTDGSSDGNIFYEVDESGGTTADYSLLAIAADVVAGSGYDNFLTITVPVPAGSQFQFRNNSDPTGNNAVNEARAILLS